MPKEQQEKLRSRTRLIAAVVILVGIGVLLFSLSNGTYVALFGERLEIPDPGLEHALRQATGIHRRPMIKSDLARVKQLDVGMTNYLATAAGKKQFVRHGDNIERPTIDLDGLQHCVNLEELSMEYVKTSDVNTLANLPSLKVLDLKYWDIADLSALQRCVRLERLTGCTGNLPPLKRLQDLEVLENVNCAEDDLKDVKDCHQLRELRLSGFLGHDLNPISQLTSLEILELERRSQRAGTTIAEDLTPLRGLTKLDRLTLVGFGRPDHSSLDLNPLKGLTSLWGIS